MNWYLDMSKIGGLCQGKDKWSERDTDEMSFLWVLILPSAKRPLLGYSTSIATGNPILGGY